MLTRLVIKLSPNERQGLFELANRHLRSPADHLRIILRLELLRNNLKMEDYTTDTPSVEVRNPQNLEEEL